MKPRRGKAWWVARPILAALAITALVQGTASAHEHRRVGELDMVVGWIDEPALAGFKNAVQVIVTRSEEPVENGTLEVLILFGDKDSETQSDTLPLEPSFGVPGQFEATVIPTRPGQYTFHITGRLAGARIDEFFTSGPDTFNDIQNPSEAEFPTRDPTRAELADRLDRLDARVAQTLAEVQGLEDRSGTDVPTLILAGAGVLLGALALALALFRRPAKGT
jgi:hypothetical protein